MSTFDVGGKLKMESVGGINSRWATHMGALYFYISIIPFRQHGLLSLIKNASSVVNDRLSDYYLHCGVAVTVGCKDFIKTERKTHGSDTELNNMAGRTGNDGSLANG